MSEVVISAGERSIRTINEEIQAAIADGNEVRVVDTLSRHNLGIGLPAGARVSFEGVRRGPGAAAATADHADFDLILLDTFC